MANAIVFECLVEYIFGATSPNKRITAVIPKISIVNRTQDNDPAAGKAFSRNSVDIMATQTFTKLFPMSIVANKSFGRCNSFDADFELRLVSFSMSNLSLGLKEKNATSDAEKIAERAINTITEIAKITMSEVVIAVVMGKGSSIC